MMLTDAQHQEAAHLLMAVHETRELAPSLVTTFPGIGVEDAYRIQEIMVEQCIADGASIKGYKVGLTSKVMQEKAGIDEPDFSVLLDNMFVPEASTVDLNRYFEPNLEIELAFVMGRELAGPHVNAADVIRATDFVLPAIEMVEKRVVQRHGVVDTIADFASCAAVVLGGNPRNLADIDVRTVRGRVSKNGEFVTEGQASAVMGNPVNAVAWLANKLQEFGVAFRPGDVVLSGSFTTIIPTADGDSVVASFDSGLGDIQLQFRQ